MAKRRNVFAREIAAKRRHKKAIGTSSMEDRMIENYQDVLQNIEFTLIECYRENNEIDDATIALALRCAILSEQPQNDLADGLVDALAQAREIREDVSDDLWCDCMRTVLRSVDRHSNLKPGKRDYIHFVSPYII